MPSHRRPRIIPFSGVLALLLSATLLQCDDTGSSSQDGDRPGPNDPAPVSYRLDAQLDGEFARGVRIEEGDWSAVGSRQEIELTFHATGMSNVKQFEFDLEFEPRHAFDLAQAQFAPAEPLLTLPPGVQHLSNGQLKIAAANFTGTTEGDAVLGTLTLETSESLTVLVQAHIRVSLFSIGPLSTNRETYDADHLNMGIILNKR